MIYVWKEKMKCLCKSLSVFSKQKKKKKGKSEIDQQNHKQNNIEDFEARTYLMY